MNQYLLGIITHAKEHNRNQWLARVMFINTRVCGRDQAVGGAKGSYTRATILRISIIWAWLFGHFISRREDPHTAKGPVSSRSRRQSFFALVMVSGPRRAAIACNYCRQRWAKPNIKQSINTVTSNHTKKTAVWWQNSPVQNLSRQGERMHLHTCRARFTRVVLNRQQLIRAITEPLIEKMIINRIMRSCHVLTQLRHFKKASRGQ